jgi:hypothetical protein
MAAAFRNVSLERLPLVMQGPTRADLKNAIFANRPPFNANGRGMTDDTSALRSAFDLAIATGRTLVLQGKYRVSGPLVDGITRSQGALNLHFDEFVEIEVDKSAKRFETLIHLMTEQPIKSLFTGTGLAMRLNARCACGIIVRYLLPTATGQLVWLAQVKVYDAFNDSSNKTTNNYGIAIIGQFNEVTINRPVVVGVVRARAVGESKNLAVAGYKGHVNINEPYLATVTAPQGEADVDLLALFPAPEIADAWTRRSGTASVSKGYFIDSQGRSIKLQGRAILSDNNYIRTGKVISMRESCEVDAQFDNVIESGATYRYARSKDGKSPLGEHHVLLSVQHLVGGVELRSSMKRARVFSEVPMWAGIYINQAKRTLNNSFELANLQINRAGGFSSDVFRRAIIEFDADKVEQSAGKLSIAVRNVAGPSGAPVIGYNTSSTRFFSKVNAKILDATNSGTSVAIIDSVGGKLELPVLIAQTKNIIGWKIKRTNK